MQRAQRVSAFGVSPALQFNSQLTRHRRPENLRRVYARYPIIRASWGSSMLRIVSVFVIALPLAGCGSLIEAIEGPAHAVVDRLPHWAGGPPPDLPPKPTDPRYAAYIAQLEGKATPVAAAAESSLSPLH